MTDFHDALQWLQQTVYEPSGWIVEGVQEERQNAKYAGGIFTLNGKRIRLRVAHVTPTKIGQFVAIWQKNKDGKNEAFSDGEAVDYYVILVFKNKETYGQFVFPKDVLAARGVLQTKAKKGKMAIRVYPRWDEPTSKQAITTKKWQLPYFYEWQKTEGIESTTWQVLYGVR